MKNMITAEMVDDLLKRQQSRGFYERAILRFILGHDPSDAEIVDYRADREAKAKAEREWFDAQPWHYRKQRIPRDTRIEHVLRKRYNVPEWLIKEFRRQ